MRRLGSRFNYKYKKVKLNRVTYDVGVFKVRCHFAHSSDHCCKSFVLGQKDEDLSRVGSGTLGNP